MMKSFLTNLAVKDLFPSMNPHVNLKLLLSWKRDLTFLTQELTMNIILVFTQAGFISKLCFTIWDVTTLQDQILIMSISHMCSQPIIILKFLATFRAKELLTSSMLSIDVDVEMAFTFI